MGSGGVPSQWIKRPWTEEQDQLLREAVAKHGARNWSSVAKMIPTKNGKQCRERWINHIDPAINWEPWTHEDDMKLIEAHSRIGNKWTDLGAIYTTNQPRVLLNSCPHASLVKLGWPAVLSYAGRVCVCSEPLPGSHRQCGQESVELNNPAQATRAAGGSGRTGCTAALMCAAQQCAQVCAFELQ